MHSLLAAYAGDSSFNASSAPLTTLLITRAPTSVTATATPAIVSAAATVTLSAAITSSSYGLFAPTGIVTFSTGATVLGTSKLQQGTDAVTFTDRASATLTLSDGTFTVGSDPIMVSYPGDTNYLPSASPAAPLTVTPTTLIVTTTALTLSPTTVAPGGTVTFSALVKPASGTATPTGTIQFAVDGQDFAAPVALTSGVATLPASVTTLSIGGHTVTAVYSGDAAFRSSISPRRPSPSPPPAPPAFPLWSSHRPPPFREPSSPSPSTSPPPPHRHRHRAAHPGWRSLQLAPAARRRRSHLCRQLHPLTRQCVAHGQSPPHSAQPHLYGHAHRRLPLPVTFACTGLPAFTTCSFSPTICQLSGFAPVAVVLTINLNTGLHPSYASKNLGLEATVTFAGLLTFFLPRRRHRLSGAGSRGEPYCDTLTRSSTSLIRYSCALNASPSCAARTYSPSGSNKRAFTLSLR